MSVMNYKFVQGGWGRWTEVQCPMSNVQSRRQRAPERCIRSRGAVYFRFEIPDLKRVAQGNYDYYESYIKMIPMGWDHKICSVIFSGRSIFHMYGQACTTRFQRPDEAFLIERGPGNACQKLASIRQYTVSANPDARLWFFRYES